MTFKWYFGHKWIFFLLAPWSRTSAGRLCGNQTLPQSQRLKDFWSTVAACLFARLWWLLIRFTPSALPVTKGRKLASPSNPTLLQCWPLLRGPNIDENVTHSNAGPIYMQGPILSSINCWCSSTSECNVISKHNDDHIVLYVLPVRLKIDDCACATTVWQIHANA